MMTEPAKDTYRPKPGTKLRRALDLAYDEIHGRIEDEDRAFLETEPILWLRSLRMVRATMNHRIKAKALELERLKPDSGVSPTKAYLEARKLYNRQHQSYSHVWMVAGIRIEELLTGLGHEHIGEVLSIGDVIDKFDEILVLLRDEDFKGAALAASKATRDLQSIDVHDITDDLEEALQIIEDTVDDEECQFDHHGHCQMHSWPNEEECPNARGIRLLAKYEDEEDGK